MKKDAPTPETLLCEGTVLQCTECSNRVALTSFWLERVALHTGGPPSYAVIPRLRCECGTRGRVEIVEPRLSKEDYLHVVKRLREDGITIEAFYDEMLLLKEEANPLALLWFEKFYDTRPTSPSSRRERVKAPAIRPWLDWDLGTSRRQGKRNRMY